MRFHSFLLLFIWGPFIACSQAAGRFDVVITEIMADPSPVVGLPNAEYIELRNVSSRSFSLSGWKLSDANSTVTITSAFILQPDSLVILCSVGNSAVLSPYARTLGVPGFPSLDNDGDLLSIRSPQGSVIHAVQYETSWYQSESKKDGGWSLEMIAVSLPCAGFGNWKASMDPRGGTPGTKNSNEGPGSDDIPPRVLRTYSVDSTTVMVLFDEPMDSTSISAPAHFHFSRGLTISSVTAVAPQFNAVIIRLLQQLDPQVVYEVSASNVRDCKGNLIGAYNHAKAGIARQVAAADIVVNEILFNPRPNAYDYVELFNRSAKIIDASTLTIAHRNAQGAPASIKKISEDPFLIFPGDFIVLTQQVHSLQIEYLVRNPEHVLTLASLPSYPDEKGTVLLSHSTGWVIDEVQYSRDWHFTLLSGDEGVALERLDPDGASQQADNWHSASTAAGYGTPTYQNSQAASSNARQVTLEIIPKLFSPDGDGLDDHATITCRVSDPGYVANIFIYDAHGNLQRQFVHNALTGINGSWAWDGRDQNGITLPAGPYVVLAELFNLQGKVHRFKQLVVVARKFK